MPRASHSLGWQHLGWYVHWWHLSISLLLVALSYPESPWKPCVLRLAVMVRAMILLGSSFTGHLGFDHKLSHASIALRGSLMCFFLRQPSGCLRSSDTFCWSDIPLSEDKLSGTFFFLTTSSETDTESETWRIPGHHLRSAAPWKPQENIQNCFVPLKTIQVPLDVVNPKPSPIRPRSSPLLCCSHQKLLLKRHPKWAGQTQLWWAQSIPDLGLGLKLCKTSDLEIFPKNN